VRAAFSCDQNICLQSNRKDKVPTIHGVLWCDSLCSFKLQQAVYHFIHPSTSLTFTETSCSLLVFSKHSLNQTEELGSLTDRRKSDTHHKGCADYCSELSIFSVVCLTTTDSKSVILQYKKRELHRE